MRSLSIQLILAKRGFIKKCVSDAGKLWQNYTKIVFYAKFINSIYNFLILLTARFLCLNVRQDSSKLWQIIFSRFLIRPVHFHFYVRTGFIIKRVSTSSKLWQNFTKIVYWCKDYQFFIFAGNQVFMLKCASGSSKLWQTFKFHQFDLQFFTFTCKQVLK